MLFSPLKDLPDGVRKKLRNHWSTHFYEHIFTQIYETKFERLYHDGYSRPNKPVNELVSLEIIKHLLGMSDEELEHAYVLDFRVRNALGKETLRDNICQKTFTNFRRRLMEHEEETGQDLLHEVFEDHRSYFQEEFEIDASTQRMDSTFIEANIKQLSRVDLLAKVLHNFLCDLLDEDVTELSTETGLRDLLVDGGYTHKEVEKRCRDQEITQHFSGITGQRPAEEKMSLAAPEWDGTRMVACPAGHEPFDQNHYETGRISGKMDKEFCDGCPHRENCFVEEQQQYYSYGFRERRVEVAQRRKRLDDPAEQEFLKLRAGAESLINEMYHKDGEKTKFIGKIKVKNGSIAKAIGRNLKRASRFLKSEAKREKSAG
jgi:hypothetical protein